MEIPGLEENPPTVYLVRKKGRKKKTFARNILEWLEQYKDGIYEICIKRE